MVFASAGASGGAPTGAGDGGDGERRRDEDYRPAEAGTGNSRTSKSERTVGHRAVLGRSNASIKPRPRTAETAGYLWARAWSSVRKQSPLTRAFSTSRSCSIIRR